MAMKRFISAFTALVAALVWTSSVTAATKTETRMNNAIEVLRTFTEIPEQAIPEEILRDAYGVAILPGVIKVGFTIGGRFGRGVLMVRQEDGSWSNPAFISLGGGSLGLQIGAQSTDILLVFRDQRSINNIYNGKLTIGGDASAAAGPVGRNASAATDERLGAEIYSYSRSRGLFAGIALDGAWIAMDQKGNDEYYNNGMTAEEIFAAGNMPAPAGASQLVGLLAATAPRLDGAPVSRSAQATIAPAPAAAAPAPAAAEVKTYALEPIDNDTPDGPPINGRDETVF
jgi:lipid-binding SYLF domain-containing protein